MRPERHLVRPRGGRPRRLPASLCALALMLAPFVAAQDAPLPGAMAGPEPKAGGTTGLLSEVPFTSCEGLICLQVVFEDGTRRTLALDTGNIASAIASESLPKSWKLEAYVGRDSRPVDGLFKTGPHIVTLGSERLSVPMLVLPARQLAPKKAPFDGTLAFTVLLDRIVQIDFAHHRLRLSSVLTAPSDLPLPGTLSRVTFGKTGPPILVGGPFSVNGHPVQAQIDTCFTGSLIVYEAAVSSLGLAETADSGTPRSFPYTDGGVTMRAAKVQSIGFADHGLPLAQPKIFLANSRVHQPDGLFEATVGNDLFRNMVLTLDLHDMRFELRAAAQ